MNEMPKKAFNQYIAVDVNEWHIEEVEHGYNDIEEHWFDKNGQDMGIRWHWDWFDDANQRHEVFDKLYGKNKGSLHNESTFMYASLRGIDQAEREFIWSTRNEN